jgi:hypothetical protein
MQFVVNKMLLSFFSFPLLIIIPPFLDTDVSSASAAALIKQHIITFSVFSPGLHLLPGTCLVTE